MWHSQVKNLKSLCFLKNENFNKYISSKLKTKNFKKKAEKFHEYKCGAYHRNHQDYHTKHYYTCITIVGNKFSNLDDRPSLKKSIHVPSFFCELNYKGITTIQSISIKWEHLKCE
jgi:hypothetical protein